MTQKPTRPDSNHLLALLPPKVAAELLASSERVELDEGHVGADPEKPIEHVFFPLTAVLSILSVLSDRSGVETCVAGNEGMAPLAAFHRVDTATEQVVAQVPGFVLRVPVARFHQLLDDHPRFTEMLHRYAMACFTFAAQTSGCNRRHTVVQRCARWLLQTHDRVPED